MADNEEDRHELDVDERPVFMPAQWDISQLDLEHVL